MKVRIRKALPHETPSYKSKLSGFLTKAAKGMEVQTRDESSDLVNFIIDSFESGTEAEDIISTLTDDYNIATDKAKYYTKYVQDNYLPDPLLEDDDEDDDEEDKVKINDDKIENDKVEDLAEDADPNADLYNMEDSGISGGDYGDGLDLNPDEMAKFGGSKSKTIKYFKKLLKAKEGLEAPEEGNSQPNVRGTVNNPSTPFNNNKDFVSAINNQVKDSFYNTQAEKMYEQQANNEFGFGGNRRIKRANKAFFGTKTAPVGVDADYKFGLLGNLKEGTIKWDPNMAINMMQQFGVNQGPQGFGYDPGYGGGSWSNSYNTGWERTTTPGTIVREKIIKSINNAADPTKVNNVALNNKPNGTANTNTEWQNSSRKAEKASVDAANKAYDDYYFDKDYVPSGMPDFEFTPGIHEDRKWSSPINQVDYINVDDKIRNEKGKIDWKVYNNLSQEEKEKIDQESYLQKDSKGNEYSVVEGHGTPEFEAEENRLINDYIDKESLYDLNQRFSPNVDPNVRSFWSPYTEPIEEEDGGFVDPSQMQPGVLQKFFSGGYDDITQEDIDFTNSKNTTGSYREGGIKEFAGDEDGSQVDSFNEGYSSDAEEQFGIDRQANKEAYRKQVAEGKTRDKYDPNVNYTGTTNTKTNTYNNQGSNQSFNQGFSQGSNQGWYDPRQAAFAIPNKSQGRDGSFKNMLSQFMPVTNDMTWYNQTAGPLGAIKEGYAPSQLKYSKQRKTDGTWAERKLGFNKDRFVDVSYTKLGANNKPGVGVYAPGQGVNANMKPGNNNAPGTSSDTQDIKKFQDSQKAQGKVWDEQTQKWVSGTKGPAYEGFNADSNGNTIPNYLDPTSPDVMPGSNPGTKPIDPNLAYGGYMSNDYMAYGGYLPEAQFGKVGPFMTNDTDCTDQQKRDPQSPCYDANFAIPAFAKPGASIQEMMGIDNINCSEEDKLDPESDCYVDPDPNSITKRFKVNKAKTVNFGAIGAGANLAGNAIGALGEGLASNKKGNTNMGKLNNSMNRVPMKQTVDNGLTTQEGWTPDAGYDSTGRMTAAKGGSVNNEGDITYMSSKQIKEFLKNGGQLEFQ